MRTRSMERKEEEEGNMLRMSEDFIDLRRPPDHPQPEIESRSEHHERSGNVGNRCDTVY
jgi:hypothetical protein